MRFKVTMKDPDSLQDAIAEAVRAEVKAIPGLSTEEREAVEEKRKEEASKVVGRWFEYSEYLTVQIDTEAGTAVVCERDR